MNHAGGRNKPAKKGEQHNNNNSQNVVNDGGYISSGSDDDDYLKNADASSSQGGYNANNDTCHTRGSTIPTKKVGRDTKKNSNDENFCTSQPPSPNKKQSAGISGNKRRIEVISLVDDDADSNIGEGLFGGASSRAAKRIRRLCKERDQEMVDTMPSGKRIGIANAAEERARGGNNNNNKSGRRGSGKGSARARGGGGGRGSGTRSTQSTRRGNNNKQHRKAPALTYSNNMRMQLLGSPGRISGGGGHQSMFGGAGHGRKKKIMPNLSSSTAASAGGHVVPVDGRGKPVINVDALSSFSSGNGGYGRLNLPSKNNTNMCDFTSAAAGGGVTIGGGRGTTLSTMKFKYSNEPTKFK